MGGYDPYLPWITYYGLAVAIMLPAMKDYRHTPLGPVVLIALLFVVFPPIVLVYSAERTNNGLAEQLMRWHIIVTGAICCVAIVSIVIHWLVGA